MCVTHVRLLGWARLGRHAAVESTFIHEEMGFAKLGSAVRSRLLWDDSDTSTARSDRRRNLFGLSRTFYPMA